MIAVKHSGEGVSSRDNSWIPDAVGSDSRLARKIYRALYGIFSVRLCVHAKRSFIGGNNPGA